MRQSLSGRTQGEFVFLLGSVPVHGVRAADVSGEPARHRGVPACPAVEAVSPRHSRRRWQRNTLANANAVRDWRIYADFAQSLIGIARPALRRRALGVDLKDTVYALDATTIDLCLSLFPWAPFRSTKAAIKLHTLLDLRGNIPTFIHISDGKLHEVNVLDQLLPEPGAFYVMDRGYLDFERLYRFHQAGSFFVTRAKIELQVPTAVLAPCRPHHRPALRSDHRSHRLLHRHGPIQAPLRRIRFSDSRDRQDADLPDQQLRPAGTHDHRALPLPLAGRALLQVDQAASADQSASSAPRRTRSRRRSGSPSSVYVLVAKGTLPFPYKLELTAHGPLNRERFFLRASGSPERPRGDRTARSRAVEDQLEFVRKRGVSPS